MKNIPRVRSFKDLVGVKLNFNGAKGIVSQYDSWDTYLCTFENGFQRYFDIEQILLFMEFEDRIKRYDDKSIDESVKVEVSVMEL